MGYQVEVEVFRGPLDLLLYLVRRHEVNVLEVPLAEIAEAYLEYLGTLADPDINAAGEFLVLSSTLAEMKSREALPLGGEEEELDETPRDDLVRHLLEYKKYRDAASLLEEQAQRWQLRYSRMANDLPPRNRDLAEEPIHELELWDLVSAFSRLNRDNHESPGTNIVYDDTPIETHMKRIHGQLVDQGRLGLSDLFAPGMHKSQLVGMFLAVLELVRHYGVHVEQEELFGELWLLPATALEEPSHDFGHPLEFSAEEIASTDLPNSQDTVPQDTVPQDTVPQDTTPEDTQQEGTS